MKTKELVGSSGYTKEFRDQIIAVYAWFNNGNKRNLKQQELNLLTHQIRAEYELSNKTYGSRKIYNRLKPYATKIGRNKVAGIMKREGIKSNVCHKYKVCTTDSNHRLPVYENKLNRGFNVLDLIMPGVMISRFVPLEKDGFTWQR